MHQLNAGNIFYYAATLCSCRRIAAGTNFDMQGTELHMHGLGLGRRRPRMISCTSSTQLHTLCTCSSGGDLSILQHAYYLHLYLHTASTRIQSPFNSTFNSISVMG
jgi:hypothetical protein